MICLKYFCTGFGDAGDPCSSNSGGQRSTSEQKPCSGSSASSEDIEESTDSNDDDWYGEVKEYFKDEDWKVLPKYLKRREKRRLELHNERIQGGEQHILVI